MNELVDAVIPWIGDLDVKNFSIAPEDKKKLDVSPNRYRDLGTLPYVVKSIRKFAPWVNKIFIITHTYKDIQELIRLYPELARDVKNEKIRIITHDHYIPPEFLPTWNSNVIEAFLGRIVSLSEYFLLFNDDMFLGAPVEKKDFFEEKLGYLINARYQFLEKKLPDKASKHNYVFNETAKNSRKFIEKSVASMGGLFPTHQVKPYKKSFIDLFEKEYLDYLESNHIGFSDTRFRSDKDIALQLVIPNRAGVVFVGSALGDSWRRNYEQQTLSHFYTTIYPSRKANANNYEHIRQTRPHLFCINDVRSIKKEEAKRQLITFLESYYG